MEALFWLDDVPKKGICDWSTFMDIWRGNCPKVRIRSPCHDTCGECTIYQNSFRYKESKRDKSKDVAEKDDASVDSVDSDDLLPTEREVLKEMEVNEDFQQTESLIQVTA
jgi:hypothetical protein